MQKSADQQKIDFLRKSGEFYVELAVRRFVEQEDADSLYDCVLNFEKTHQSAFREYAAEWAEIEKIEKDIENLLSIREAHLAYYALKLFQNLNWHRKRNLDSEEKIPMHLAWGVLKKPSKGDSHRFLEAFEDKAQERNPGIQLQFTSSIGENTFIAEFPDRVRLVWDGQYRDIPKSKVLPWDADVLVNDLRKKMISNHGAADMAWEDGYTYKEVDNILGTIQAFMDSRGLKGKLVMVWDASDQYVHFNGSSELWLVKRQNGEIIGLEVTIPLAFENGIADFIQDAIKFQSAKKLKPIAFDMEFMRNATIAKIVS